MRRGCEWWIAQCRRSRRLWRCPVSMRRKTCRIRCCWSRPSRRARLLPPRAPTVAAPWVRARPDPSRRIPRRAVSPATRSGLGRHRSLRVLAAPFQWRDPPIRRAIPNRSPKSKPSRCVARRKPEYRLPPPPTGAHPQAIPSESAPRSSGSRRRRRQRSRRLPVGPVLPPVRRDRGSVAGRASAPTRVSGTRRQADGEECKE